MIAPRREDVGATDQGTSQKTYLVSAAGVTVGVVLLGHCWNRWLDADADVEDLLNPETIDQFRATKCGVR
jgi:hypothetical protein